MRALALSPQQLPTIRGLQIACVATPGPQTVPARRMQQRPRPQQQQQVRHGHAPYLPPSQLQQNHPTHHGAQQQHQYPHVPHHAPHHHAPPPAALPGPARHLTTTTFASLPLSPASQKALGEVLGFTHLTEVQNATLPAVLAGGDVMARAKTGTGKTMAFLIPAIEALVRCSALGGGVWQHGPCSRAVRRVQDAARRPAVPSRPSARPSTLACVCVFVPPGTRPRAPATSRCWC